MQRRWDRYGQKHQLQIVYLFTEATTDKIKKTCASSKSYAKDEQAALNLRPLAFLNVF